MSNFILDNTKEEAPLRGDSQKDFKCIYDETMTLLYRIAYKIVNDEEIAEDMAHDSLLKVHEKAMVFPTLNDAKYWLIRVVKNASLNYVKRRGRQKIAYDKALRENTRDSESAEAALLKKETKDAVLEALDKLPDKLKAILILREYADLNYKEIGRVLGITEGNVKVRVFRARERLSKLLGEDDVYMP